MRWIVGRNGIVENVVEAVENPAEPGQDGMVDPTGATNIGAAYDPKDVQLDHVDIVALRTVFNHENRIRALERFARAVNNGASNTAGVEPLPRAAVTLAQFRNAIKALF